MIIVGAGNLGQALANYVNFENRILADTATQENEISASTVYAGNYENGVWVGDTLDIDILKLCIYMAMFIYSVKFFILL